jgi:hypothetical protein
MIKLNRGRCEQFAMLEGISTLCKIANSSENYNTVLIPIFTELIDSTVFSRDKLKQANALELILYFVKNKSYKDHFHELIRSLLEWLGYDKNFVEEIIIQENNFVTLFQNINDELTSNLTDYLSVLNEFFRNSETIEKQFFNSSLLVKSIIQSINTSNALGQKDILLLNKIMDFYESLIKNKNSDSTFLTEINFNRTLDKIKSISKENNLIIIDEKIKKINSYILK